MREIFLVFIVTWSSSLAQAQTDELKKVIALQQSQLMELRGLVPKGSILAFSGEKAPKGWAICDGSLLSTTQHAGLFAVIGYRYGGSGDSFALPDLRDDFIRGASASRPAGNRETFATAKGGLSATTSMTTSPTITTSGQYQSGWPTGHFAKSPQYGTTVNEGNWGTRVMVGQSAPNEGEPFYFTVTSSGSAAGGSWSTELKSSDAETRPRNLALHYIIKL